MSAPKPPSPPDPAKTAAAQTQSNKDTAVAQYGLNATNQVTPYGNLTYDQIGKWDDGTPRFQATQNFSPDQQALFDLNNKTEQRIGQIGYDQSGRIGELLSKPVDLSNEATESRIFQLGRNRLDPLFAERKSALETDLINRGVTSGSEAYERAVGRLGQQENDAYNELLLSGRGQSVSEALTSRNQPINEITALLSGSQVSQPNYVTTPSPGVAPTDVIGAYNNAYQGEMAGYNAEASNRNAMMGGLFGLAAAPLGGWAYGGKLPMPFGR